MIVRNTEVPYVFVHNPRTSGTSITSFLMQYCGGVLSKENNEANNQTVSHRVYAAKTRNFDNHFKFGFVRNPYSRELSLYKLLVTNNEISYKEWLLIRFLSYPASPTLQQKLMYYKLPQYGYFCDINGNIAVNVYKYEERQTALEDIGNALKINLSQIHRYRPSNNSPKFDIHHYHQNYDNEMIDIIENAYKIDLDYFGYSFDGFKDALPVNFKFQGDVRYYSSNYVNPEVFYRYK